MLIDFHGHSSGISRCCKKSGEEIILITKNNKMDGMILTNHYDCNYVVDNNPLLLAEKYVDEYRKLKKYSDDINFKLFFGIEVTMAKNNNAHMLIYGVDEEFILDYPDIYNYDQKKLYEVVHENNGILIQAHPFRKNINALLDLKYLDGLEINCHPKYDNTHIEKLSKIAKDNKLLLTCGGDFHADTHRSRCGVYVPDELKNTLDIIEFLKNSLEIKLCVQEVNSIQYYDFKFIK